MRIFLLIFLLIFSLDLSANRYSDSLTIQSEWKFKTGGKIYSTARAFNNAIYFGSEDRHVYALDSKTGSLLWKFETGAAIYSSPAISENKLFILSMDGNLYALSTKGKLLWKFKTGGEKIFDTWDYYQSDPIVRGDTVYFGSSDYNIYAVKASSGKLCWQYKTGGMVHASPVLKNDSLFIGSYDGFLYALSADSGKLLWKFHSIGDAYFPNGEFQKAPLLHDNTLYVGSRDYNIYALDANTGRGKWNMKERGSWIIATPFQHNKLLYFGTSDSHAFYCMDAEYGEMKWKLPLNMRVYGSAVFANGLIWFGCFNGKLYGVDPLTGTINKVFQTESSRLKYASVYDSSGTFRKDFQLYGNDYLLGEKKLLSLGSFMASPLVYDDHLYIGSADGFFYSIKL
jgi:outer membrane protein assembly factor BamB